MIITKLNMIRLTTGSTREEMAQFICLNPTHYSRLENYWEQGDSAATNDKLVTVIGDSFGLLMEPVTCWILYLGRSVKPSLGTLHVSGIMIGKGSWSR